MSMSKIFWVVTFWAVIVSCCLFCTGTSQDLTRCGIQSIFKRTRIVGGRQAYPGQWPWQVAIFYTDASGTKQFHCGGALIHARWVLSAAHCFSDDTNPQSYTVKAGDYDIYVKDSTEQERQTRKIILHHDYRDYPFYENDIALLELSQNINLTTRHISTVCLPEAGENLSTPGAVVHVAGWGHTRWRGRLSAILLHSAYQIQNSNTCRRATAKYLNQTVTFCAGDGKGGNDTCQRDSGGSLVRQVLRKGRQRWVTVGLVSWGEGCARVGKYGYNTRVEPFVDWIRKAMVCDLSLGMEERRIPDGNIRASTIRDQYHTAKEGRLHGQRAWCSGSEKNPYLEIDLGKSYIITGLATQGSSYDTKWVKNYTMRGNLVGSTFYPYRELGIEKVFIGNTDDVSVVKHRLRNPFIGKKLRIYPVKKGGTSSACMRVEIYGCDLPSGCVIPGTRVVAKWPPVHEAGYVYLRGYLTEISFSSWRVDLENENHAKFKFIYFSKIFDLAFVLDVPPSPRQLASATRVLAPRGYRYYTGTVIVRQRDLKYRVRADDGVLGSFTIDQLRLLKMPSVCK